ncbi:glycoside hydrolase family 15 protein [Sulfobacillus sp. hq2]|uniref:glycoside hydrolase family 15 protein n=1 Tax=Sulfobacillus sp. hq2 TaxID=2039167 RepID=UPI000CD130BB|nr:glycoside hydrolase family 15 protein [Sulfobacillus sp. hq2]POB11861.1 glycoside hydrolase family 15 [Sulfobacillus sp. hq2]
MKPFYALLANGLTTALAGPTGAVDWWPVPRFDGPTIFSRLLDHHAGGYLSLEPEGYTTVTQRYRPEGLFLETHFECPGGFATITTGLEVGRNALWLTANSTVPLVLTCRPSFDYGVVRPSFVPLPHGMRFINPVGPGQAALIIQGPAELMSRMDQWRCGPGRLTVVFRVLMEAKPDWRWLSAPVPTDADRIWAKSSAFWALPTAAQDTEEPIRRSLLIIKGLTFRPTGAPVAAATTSLPEAPGESRQWDYRYVWVRDSAYSGESLLLTGNVVEAKRIAEFLLNSVLITGRVYPTPFLRVDGTVPEREHDLLWLRGYEQTRPARAGNGAISQRQLDLVGSVLWLVYRIWQETHDDLFVQSYWWAITALAEWAQRTWHQDDASLWEYRTIRGQHTHSRMMNWLGLTTAAAMARQAMHDDIDAKRWQDSAEKIATALWKEAQQAGSFLPRSTGGIPDAALLTLPLYGFVSVHNPYFINTLKIIESTLVDNGLVYRYRADDLGKARFPFLLVGFWYARVLLRQGRHEEAQHVIERHLAQATPLGLYGEHADEQTGTVRGNFPQLFSHSALVTTLMEQKFLAQGRPLPEYALLTATKLMG